MEWIYLGMVIFLFVLAAFDLWVGVSNDAVNFLNSAIGSKVARFRTIVCVAALGVFCGAVMSDGMMDIARHGIFRPEMFHFDEIMCIFVAVMVTDIVLLDVFNTLGMPTSTTVSMVFELLGATFALTLLKMQDAPTAATFGDYMNTDKALQVILAIFLSVAVAFVFGAFIQWLARLVFTFHYRDGRLSRKVGLFGGLAITAIVYFMLFKGLKHLSFMTPEVKDWIDTNVWVVLGCTFVFFTLLMQVLHALRVNVFRVVVLSGTFALATAFAGNDLVNFIGVPLAGFSSFSEFSNAGGADPAAFTMESLNGPATTPLVFLIAAGVIMVVSLATSKKAHNVVKTEVGLARSGEGEEMFGSSRVARSLVRWGNAVGENVVRWTPAAVRSWVDSRFHGESQPEAEGAAYDLVRASVNLVVAALLIALGTSLKLPLSTTYVTFMVSMGSSLADRAWSRESAVFRITGVLTVIGGWFITAGVAFTACFFVALTMYYGGIVAMAILVAAGLFALIHSQRRYKAEQSKTADGDLLFTQMLTEQDTNAILPMLERHLNVASSEILLRYADELTDTIEGLGAESLRPMRRAEKCLRSEKRVLKNLRRRETICLRRTPAETAIRLSTSFNLAHNALRQLHYGLVRISEPALEHVDNHFTPIRTEAFQPSHPLQRWAELARCAADCLRHQRLGEIEGLRNECTRLREEYAQMRRTLLSKLSAEDVNLTAATLHLHIVQEGEQLCVELRRLLGSMRQFREQQ